MTDPAELQAMQNIKRWRESPATMVRELFKAEPDPWQEEALEAYGKYPRLAMKACKGPGKCISFNELVETPNGQRGWSSLRVGDTLFAEDGSITRIQARYDQGKVPLFRVVFDDGSSLVVGLDHLWKVRGRTERRHGTWSILTTEQINKRGVREKNGRWAGRQFEIPQHGAVQFSHVIQPIDPYVLGIWLGDGSKGSGSYTGIDVEVEWEIRLRGYLLGKEIEGKTKTIYGIATYLRKLGIKDLGSHERYVPNCYRYASIQQRKDLLGGLLDADGCIGTDAHCEFGSTSKKLAEDVIWLVRSLGGNATFKPANKKGKYRDKRGKIIECRDCYRVTVTLPFNPFRVGHKAKRWHLPQARYLTRYIDRIEPAGEGEAMCVEVDHPSHCYLAKDFIVTHNTCVLAWIAWNFLLTRPQPKVLATSISGDNLADGLWTEMDLWRGKSKLLQQYFEWTKTRIYQKGQYETTWWMAARQWSQSADKSQQANTLAGRHADYILFLLDESGGIPDAVMVTAEAALSSCVEGHIVQAGNPTHLTGPLYRACSLEKANWKVIEITGDPDDPKRSSRISMDWAKQMIGLWGREHPYVLVNVLGRFPPSSFNALIGPDEVRDSMNRYYRDFEIGNAPKVLGVDVALFGDDQSVIAFRHGLQMWPFKKYRNLQPSQGASIVSREWTEFGAQAAFVDATGGAGAGWVDGLLLLGRSPIGVQFSGQAHEAQRYANKRAEMYFEAVNWIKRGGALPKDDNLLAQLTATTFTYAKRDDRFIIEPKEMVKAKLNGHSPDEADAFILTFAEPVMAQEGYAGKPRHQSEYNPFADSNRTASGRSRFSYEYDPYRDPLNNL